jgi:hypothetical protein
VATPRTKAILKVLGRGRQDEVAHNVLKVFGASSLEECVTIYDAVGKAERATLEEAVERMAASAGAAFWLGVENEMRG